MPAVYQKPGFATERIFNPLMSGIVKLGLSPRGANILLVRGRTSGEWRATPVNPLTVAGERYLVAPRGATHWVRNLRAAGGGKLRRGRTETEFRAVEIADAEKVPVLRDYLKLWKAETGKFFGLKGEPTVADLERIAPSHPIFRILREE